MRAATVGAMNELISARRARVAATLPLDAGILVVSAGEPVPLPEGSDQTYPFRSHADYLYLGGVRIEDNVLVTSDQPEVLTQGIPKYL